MESFLRMEKATLVPTIAHLEDGFRGTLEHGIAEDLKSKKAKFEYETIRIKWSYLTHRTYKPDFILSNGIIIEAKGFFGRLWSKFVLWILSLFGMTENESN